MHEQDIPPADELHDVAQQISPPAFDNYVRQIQPLLINRCAASGCHGVTSKSEFQLLRPLTGVKLTQRMTQRNLHAVLAQVDRTAPLSSQLLTAATQPHASLTEPLLHEQTDRVEFEALKGWLQAVGGKKLPAAHEPIVQPSSPPVLLQPTSKPTAELPPNVQIARPRSPQDAKQAALQNRRQALDGEAFNRHFFPERFPPAGVPQP